MTVTPIQSAKAVWSHQQDGWLVRIVYLSGTVNDIAPAPSVYHEPRDADRDHIVRETLNYENLEMNT